MGGSRVPVSVLSPLPLDGRYINIPQNAKKFFGKDGTGFEEQDGQEL